MTLKIERFPQVYPPQMDTFLLLENLDPTHDDVILELGTGCGVIALHLAQTANKVYATDTNPFAVENARHNAKMNCISNVVIAPGDLYEPVQGKRFDLIVANPPYVPTPPDWHATSILETAWNGGTDGRRLIDRIIQGLAQYLKADGRLVLVQSSLADIPKTQRQLKARRYSCRIVAQKWLPLGPVSRSRYPWLKRQSTFIHPDAELLVVIEARKRSDCQR
ncbi:MAG: methyltransferase [Candidatus Poribacteria bacterium]|nr:methyltransferase [Candidatus Poribacteria bacterium]